MLSFNAGRPGCNFAHQPLIFRREPANAMPGAVHRWLGSPNWCQSVLQRDMANGFYVGHESFVKYLDWRWSLSGRPPRDELVRILQFCCLGCARLLPRVGVVPSATVDWHHLGDGAPNTELGAIGLREEGGGGGVLTSTSTSFLFSELQGIAFRG